MRSLVSLLAALGAWGCDGGGGKDSGGEPDTATDPLVSCAELGAADCAAREDCQPIDAWPLEQQDEQTCVDYGAQAAVGCMDAGVGCDDIVTSASPPDDPGACWLFSSDCRPEGWVACGEEWGADPGSYPECPAR